MYTLPCVFQAYNLETFLSFKFRDNRLRDFGDPGAENGHSPLLWLIDYTISCTTVQAVIITFT